MAIDRTSKFVMAKLAGRATVSDVQTFLEELVSAVPYGIHTILTDTGIQFANIIRNRTDLTATFRGYPLDSDMRSIWNRTPLDKVKPSLDKWSGRTYEHDSERSDRQSLFYQSHAHLHKHLQAVISVYNFARRLKTLRGLTPYEFIVKMWTEKPELFHAKPNNLMLRLYIRKYHPKLQVLPIRENVYEQYSSARIPRGNSSKGLLFSESTGCH